MNGDCAFYIGTTHEVCQDYAMRLNNDRTSIVAVADGCSGSIFSDFGARVLSVTALAKMKEIIRLGNIKKDEIILSARPSLKILGLPIECLDATLLCAKSEGEVAEMICYGDGVMAMKLRDRDIYWILDIKYTDSRPFYLNYLYSDRLNEWREKHNKRKIVSSMIKDGEVKIIDDNVNVMTPFDISDDKTKVAGLNSTQWGIEYGVLMTIFDPNEVEFIAIMSDGVHSFFKIITEGTSKYNESISYFEILKKLLAFKNFNGKFVQRRINRFRKDCEKEGWQNYDDVSLAVIHLDKKEN